MSNNEMCRGCVYYKPINERMTCKIKPIKDDKICPCVNCIVKTMCKMMCDDYRNFDRMKQ